MSQTTQKDRLKEIFEPVAALKSLDPGLGLSYLKRIVDEHNCHIEVESQYGQGATFIIVLPLKAKSKT